MSRRCKFLFFFSFLSLSRYTHFSILLYCICLRVAFIINEKYIIKIFEKERTTVWALTCWPNFFFLFQSSVLFAYHKLDKWLNAFLAKSMELFESIDSISISLKRNFIKAKCISRFYLKYYIYTYTMKRNEEMCDTRERMQNIFLSEFPKTRWILEIFFEKCIINTRGGGYISIYLYIIRTHMQRQKKLVKCSDTYIHINIYIYFYLLYICICVYGIDTSICSSFLSINISSRDELYSINEKLWSNIGFLRNCGDDNLVRTSSRRYPITSDYIVAFAFADSPIGFTEIALQLLSRVSIAILHGSDLFFLPIAAIIHIFHALNLLRVMMMMRNKNIHFRAIISCQHNYVIRTRE